MLQQKGKGGGDPKDNTTYGRRFKCVCRVVLIYKGANTTDMGETLTFGSAITFQLN